MMQKYSTEIKPNFNKPADNITRGYEFCFNTRAYLNQKREACTLDDKTIAERSGYRNFSKFLRKRELWHAMKMAFPRKYLDVIGVDWDVLEYVVELDQEAFHEEMDKPRIPERFTVRYFAAFYGSRMIGECESEEQAIERVKAFSKDSNFRCCINYPQLKTVFIEPDGSIWANLYKPVMKITNDRVYFGDTGEGIGTVRV
ncbi:MAG: hypothetical protein GF307_03525 [candidate division Zixibacteria bacterium]|nr:hypothetical protein [candidate division Zixibacteria bacterium]